jgi:hypothetical protein
MLKYNSNLQHKHVFKSNCIFNSYFHNIGRITVIKISIETRIQVITYFFTLRHGT